jgi:hypothetical protein
MENDPNGIRCCVPHFGELKRTAGPLCKLAELPVMQNDSAPGNSCNALIRILERWPPTFANLA